VPLVKQSEVQSIINRINESKRAVVDLETTGLNFKKDKICGYGLAFSSNPNDAYYMPVRHATGNLENIDFEPELIKALDRQNLTVIMHNAHFDLRFLYEVGSNLSAKYIDTMINAALLDEYSPRFSLEYLAVVAGLTPKKSDMIKSYIKSKFPDVTKNEMGHYWRLAGNDPNTVEYACGDNTTTFELWEHQYKQLSKNDVDPITGKVELHPITKKPFNLLKVFKVECRLLPVLARMSAQGIKVDEEYLHKLKNYVEIQIHELEKQFPEGFNSRAPTEMRKLFEDNGITDWPLSPTGQPSFNSMFLEKSELGQKVIALRKLLTLKSMFIEPLMNEHIIDGRVHTTFNQLRGDGFGVVTGRISTQSPGLGQVPKRDKLCGPLFRAAFIPDNGKVWGDSDWSQAEPRLLAYYSRSKLLLMDYRTNPNADSHQAVADAAGIERHWGKHANMTIINSGGRNVLVNKYHVPEDKVDELLRKYFEVLPEVRRLQINAAARFKARGFVRTLLERKARLANPGKSYTAVNRLLQGGNADCLKLKLVEIDEYLASVGRPVDILNTVHDSISFQFEPDHLDVYEECLEIMNDFGEGHEIELDVPFKCDSDIGLNWAEATYGEKVIPLIKEVKNLKTVNITGKIYEDLMD
jgi:DNA polymerase I-like protein with 3'-5' exonuclease and polymerase domains